MTFRSDLDIVADALEHQLAQARAREVPVLAQRPLASLVSELRLDHFARQGGLEGEALRGFMARYLASIISLYHPGYVGPSWLLVSSIRPSAWYASRLCRPSVIMMKPAEDRKRDDLSADLWD